LTCKNQYGFSHKVPNATTVTVTQGRQAGYCECGTGKYKANVNDGCAFRFECKKCHDSCEKCAGPDANQCTICKTGFELLRDATTGLAPQ
jgi:hypothetical protein